MIHDMGRRVAQCRFIHFLAHFNKVENAEQFLKMNIYPKQRIVLHYIALNGHLHLMRDILKAFPCININQCDDDGTPPIILAIKNK